MKTLIIAEAGVNHNADLSVALRLVDAAADAGADIVKFQSFKANRLVTRYAAKAGYQSRNDGVESTQYEMLRGLEMSPDMHIALIEHCRKRKIEFLSTAFDEGSVKFLAELGLKTFKIPSGEITNLPYLRIVAQYAERVILSTGMATLGEVEDALDILEHSGVSRDRVVVLHCTTEYPAPFSEVNLLAMRTIQAAFGVAVGYSDHTQGIEAAIAAVALGASIIEKHFTLSRSMLGPDHIASLEPDELKAMVSAIRNIDIAMGDGVKRITASEVKNRLVARKSIVAAYPILVGEIFDSRNLVTKRPGTGISPMRWNEVLGRSASRDFAADEQIEI